MWRSELWLMRMATYASSSRKRKLPPGITLNANQRTGRVQMSAAQAAAQRWNRFKDVKEQEEEEEEKEQEEEEEEDDDEEDFSGEKMLTLLKDTANEIQMFADNDATIVIIGNSLAFLSFYPDSKKRDILLLPLSNLKIYSDESYSFQLLEYLKTSFETLVREKKKLVFVDYADYGLSTEAILEHFVHLFPEADVKFLIVTNSYNPKIFIDRNIKHTVIDDVNHNLIEILATATNSEDDPTRLVPYHNAVDSSFPYLHILRAHDIYHKKHAFEKDALSWRFYR